MTTILRFILYFLLAPAFATIAQASGVAQDDSLIVGAGIRSEPVILDRLDGGVFNYDSSGALLHQRRSLNAKSANTDADSVAAFYTYEIASGCLVATNKGLTKSSPAHLKRSGFQEHHIISDKNKNARPWAVPN